MIVTLEFYWQSLNFIFQFGCRPFFYTLALGRSIVRACMHAYVCVSSIWLVVLKWICTQTLQFYLRLTDKKTNLLFTLNFLRKEEKKFRKERKKENDDGNYGYATSSFFFLECFEFSPEKQFHERFFLSQLLEKKIGQIDIQNINFY